MTESLKFLAVSLKTVESSLKRAKVETIQKRVIKICLFILIFYVWNISILANQRISLLHHSWYVLLSKNFHTFSFSSPAPVATYWPPGLKALKSTLFWCPWTVSSLFPFIFQIMTWFKEKPWQLRIYGELIEAMIPQTWDPVSNDLITPSPSFQNFILRSPFPPPETSIFGTDQSRALTAA